MEPEGSLTSSQGPTTVAYHEPVEFSPYSIPLRSILLLSSHLCLDF